MTQKEKIRELKTTIQYLYEKEGRSKSYISRLLNVDRTALTKQIKEWNLVQANIHRLTPSNQKFANRNKLLIKSRYDRDISETQIAAELGVSRDYLRYIVERVDVLKKAQIDSMNRRKQRSKEKKENNMNSSSRNYSFEEIDGEIWKEILGHNGYYISNMGRVKKYVPTYDKYYLISQQINSRTGRVYVTINGSGLQIARLVGFAFVDGYSKERNTIDHIDNDKTNNKSCNLQWVSQSYNNKLSYDRGRSISVPYSKHKFKNIVVDNKYEFKTIQALAKFLNVSWTQASRYLNGECKINRKIEIIY